jgi:hypothetical protein
MAEIFAAILFISIALAAWRIGSIVAYMMAWFIGIGALLYTIVNGLQNEIGYVWAMTAGLFFVGFLRDRLKSN